MVCPLHCLCQMCIRDRIKRDGGIDMGEPRSNLVKVSLSPPIVGKTLREGTDPIHMTSIFPIEDKRTLSHVGIHLCTYDGIIDKVLHLYLVGTSFERTFI